MKTTQEKPLVYTSKEARKLLRVSDKVLRGMLKSGELKGKKAGRDWRIPASEIDRFMTA